MNNLRRTQLILALVAIIGLGLSSQAYGSWTANMGGNPPENLLFNDGGVSGPSIEGTTNQTSTNFTVSAAEVLLGSGGQATVTPSDGLIDTLMIFPTDPLLRFSDIEFNVGITGGNETSGVFTLSIIDQDDATTTFFGTGADFFPDTGDVTGNGSNRFRLTGSDGMFIKKATLSVVSGQIIDEITQIRLGGVAAIPEPSAFLFLGSLATLGAFGRWRKRHSS